MRVLAATCVLVLCTCTTAGQDDGDVESMEVMEKRLEAEGGSYNSTEVFDCPGGGTSKISVMWNERDEPPRKQYQVSWTYEACETFWHGTIDGRTIYSKNQEIPCFDKHGYIDAYGETCEDWAGYDCKQAEEEWGYTAEEEADLIENCAKTCDACTVWFTGVHYFADLVYTGAVNEECQSYMNMSRKTPERIRSIELSDHCKHPVRSWWNAW